MEWRKPDDYPEAFEDALIFYINECNQTEYGIGWYTGEKWSKYNDYIERCIAWMPLPPKPNFEKDKKEN